MLVRKYRMHKKKSMPESDTIDEEDDCSIESLSAKYKGILTSDQISEFKDVFDVFDTDGSGEIDYDEFQRMLESLGLKLHNKDVRLLLKNVDSDHSGEIDFGEMLEALVNNMSVQTELEHTQKAYETLDKVNKGHVTVSDIHELMGELGEAFSENDVESIVRDANHGRTVFSRDDVFNIIREMRALGDEEQLIISACVEEIDE